MQLYERGLLDLDADVNKYLTNFQLQTLTLSQSKLPSWWRTPTVLLKADRARSSYCSQDGAAEIWLTICPPLCGLPVNYTVIPATALPCWAIWWTDLRSALRSIHWQNILQPLSMRRSTFLQPPSPPLADDLAVGYQYRSGNFKPVPYLYLNIAPAAANTTAADGALYDCAPAAVAGSRILEDTVRLMHRQHFTHHPKLPGTAYGFHERLQNNMRMIEHLGSLRGILALSPCWPKYWHFTVTNNFGGVHGKLLTRFSTAIFQFKKPAPLKRFDLSDKQRFTGTYRDLVRHTFAKLTARLSISI